MISVVIRTQNSADTLSAVLQSVFMQTIKPSQVFIVDNGSSDGTVSIADSFGVDILKYDRKIFNYSHAINLGVAACCEPVVFILSSHVVLLSENTFEIALNQLDGRVDLYGGYFARASFCDLPIKCKAPIVQAVDFDSYNGFNALCNYASFIRRDLWLRRPFDVSVNSCEDQYWALDFLHDGYSGVLVKHPGVAYLNPRYSAWKEIRDYIVISRLMRKERIVSRLLRFILSALVSNIFGFRFGKALGMLRIILFLIRDAVSEIKIESKYY